MSCRPPIGAVRAWSSAARVVTRRYSQPYARASSRAVRRVQDAVHRLGGCHARDLQPVEDRPAAVAADDHLDAWLVLARRQQERPDAVQERQASVSTRVTPGAPAWTRDRDADAGGDHAVDARESAVGGTGTFLPPSTSSATCTSRDDANTSRSCGQVALQTASASATWSSGARMTSSSAAIAPSRRSGTPRRARRRRERRD